MRIFFTCISKWHSSCYLSAAFQPNIGCLSSRLPDLGIMCIGLALVMVYQLQVMLALLPVSCSIQLPFCLPFLETALCESAWFLFSSLHCLRILAFHFWHHIMLLAFNDDNTTGSFWLCCSFYILCMIIISHYLHTRVHLYTIVICTDGAIKEIFPCLLLVVTCAVCLWMALYHFCFASMSIFVVTDILIISVHAPYYPALISLILIPNNFNW